ncbi:Uracil-DNA glycosylase, family 5 [hydrothermal vent metagenome]|uniref:Type-5 uracil-DNA glycosylase n=1 Tax=hydrothermal vent metagenome TaxID=652676 RepID=A0A3B1ASY8_9ZZZZ
MNNLVFDKNCVKCPRYVKFFESLRIEYPNYYNLPVPAFGVVNPDLVIVGLAPGMHGANATGRPFTGDHAGIILYESLYKFGFSNKPKSTHKKDGLKLHNCRITNAVKCLPPQNKPIGSEINACNDYLKAEIKIFKKNTVIIALGLVAHKAVIKAINGKQSDYMFKHNAHHQLGLGHILIDSYHCSRYNTNTKRLTEKMFHDVFRKAKKFIQKLN